MIPLKESLHPAVVLAGSLVAVAFLGLTDFLTGWELSFSIFYLAPVSLATLAAGRTQGLIVAAASAAAWFGADLMAGHEYTSILVPCWNSFVRLTYFIVHTMLLASLEAALLHERELSGRDALTGVANRRHLQDLAEREIATARRSGRPLTVCYLDLDKFKAANDTLGHATGDHVLRTVAETVRGHVRPRDMFGRLGGDEFALLLPETNYEEGEAVLRRLAADLRERLRSGGWPVTVSIGAVTFVQPADSFGALLSRTDSVMYAVKTAGGDGLRHHVWPGSH